MAILRAFLWMRWRVLMNSLERTGARDRLERFSVAIEQLGPIMAAVLMIPSAIVLAGAGAYGGWSLAQGNPHPLPFEALRFLLLAATLLTIAGPFLLPANERTSAVRLLLLPISRSTLYVAETATALTDPWLALVVPVILAIPLGMLAGGAVLAALLTLVSGVLFLLVLLGTTSVATSLLHLMFRDRRRGELLALVFILVVPLVSMIPAVLQSGRVSADPHRASSRDPAWLTTFEHEVLPRVPSEMYARATSDLVSIGELSVLRPLGGLALAAGALHACGLLLFGRILESPGSTGARRRGSTAATRLWRIPAVSPGASAVALAQIRLAVRTPRGRSILLSPLIVFLMFGAMTWQAGSGEGFGLMALRSGLALAIFGSFVSLLAILPIAMNQFAIDRAGLTLEFLSPIDDRDLLRGKAIANVVTAGVPALLCVLGAALLFPGGDVALWLTVPLGFLATMLLIAPIGAALSALFPRAVDLNSIGRASNAHAAATLLGMVASSVCAGAALLIVLVATRVFERSALAPVLMLAWCAVSLVVARLLFIPVRRLLASRRENLAQLPSTRPK
ncbi:MAG: hypothetical protein WBC51_19670 [Vicinamibacterales bacterium]